MTTSTSTRIHQAIAKALHEPEVRTQLLTEPKKTLQAMNVEIPDGQTVTVLESKSNESFFVLPVMTSEELKQLEDDLDSTRSHRSIRAGILLKAWRDSTFKAKLIQDPAAVLRNEGMALPESIKITALENSPHQLYIVLPQVHIH